MTCVPRPPCQHVSTNSTFPSNTLQQSSVLGSVGQPEVSSLPYCSLLLRRGEMGVEVSVPAHCCSKATRVHAWDSWWYVLEFISKFSCMPMDYDVLCASAYRRHACQCDGRCLEGPRAVCQAIGHMPPPPRPPCSGHSFNQNAFRTDRSLRGDL